LSPAFSSAAVVLLLLLSGCSRYWPLPLTQPGVERELQPPADDGIRVAAQEIKHPILRPIEFDARDGLSPDETAVLGVLLNPELRAERDRRNLACAQLLQAKLLPNPQLDWSLEFPTGGLTADTVNAYGLGVNWDVSSLVGRGARIDAAGAQSCAVALDVAWLEWSVAESSKSAVYTLLALQQQVTLAEQLDERLRDNLKVIHQAVDKGVKTELDLSAAEAASTQAHAGLLDLKSQVAQQQIQLNRVVGLPAEREFRIQSGVELPVTLATPAADRLIEGLADRRLDLVGLRYGYASQEATVRAAVLAQFPKLNIGVLHARDTGDVVTTGFGIALDLPIFDRQQGAIARENATRQKLYDEYVNRYYQARTDVFMLLAQIKWLNQQIEAARAAEATQQRLVENDRDAVNRGQADVIVYYAAWTTLTERQIATVKLEQALSEARIALELTVGVYDLDSLAPSSGSPEEIPMPVLLKPVKE
jgi:outer membrane protein, heavy metal efflux system